MKYRTGAATMLAVTALVALLSACGGAGGKKATSPRPTLPPSTPVTTVAPAEIAAEPTTTAGGAAAGGGGNGADDTSAPAPALPEAGAGWPPAAAGTYRFDTSGVSTFALSTVPFPAVTTLVVDPPDGTRQHAARDLRDGAGNGSVQETTFDYRSEGIFLESLKLTATYSGTANAIDLRPVGQALFLPVGAAPGTHVELDVTDGAGNARVVVDVDRREAVAVGGRSVDALVVRAVASLPGPDVSGQVTLTEWFAPSLRLAVREGSVSDGSAAGGLFRFHSEYQATLQRLP